RGNRGGGRPKGVPNKATQEIKEFAREFLMSETYRANLQRRIMAGKAPQMEVLLHQYGFGKPRVQVEIASPPQPHTTVADIMKHMTKDERREFGDIFKRAEARMAAEHLPPGSRDGAVRHHPEPLDAS